MSLKEKKTKSGYLRTRGTAMAQLRAQAQADWQFVHSGEIQNVCSIQERWLASLITRKVTLIALKRATIGETAHFRAAAEPNREWEPGRCVRPGTGGGRAA
ncbi:hypothetical protein ATANTOWER_026170 [Ataeniobius toweri]|uniref:Uncharacterized protein n=1 Tax=Ataeniobius toweri TaxID=208326 RepID=A0ABU7A301_9TELE|nr:hypothetical protein [Ataeniobius toweri]